MPNKLEPVLVPLEPQRHMPSVFVGRLVCELMGERLPGRLNVQNYIRWQRIGRRTIGLITAATFGVSGLIYSAAAAWVETLDLPACQTFDTQELADTPLEAAQKINTAIPGRDMTTEDWLADLEDGSLELCNVVSIRAVEAIETARQAELLSPESTTTTLQQN